MSVSYAVKFYQDWGGGQVWFGIQSELQASLRLVVAVSTFWLSWSNPVPSPSKNNKFSFDTFAITLLEHVLTKHNF